MITKAYSLQLKYVPLYTCVRCGASEFGATNSVDIKGEDINDIPQRIASLRPTAHDMPVLWGSFLDGIRCPECVREKNDNT